MDEDEEIQSHPSSGSESDPPPLPQPLPSNQITAVTVAAVPPNSKSPSTPSSLTLALPIQPMSRLSSVGGFSGSGGGGREDCWSEGATSVLINAWGERYMELSRGNLKQKHWREVADIVSSREDYTKVPKTDIQCKNRIDTVKKKYKTEKAKIENGCGPSRWPFFERLDRLIGPAAMTTTPNASKGFRSSTVSVAGVTVSPQTGNASTGGLKSVPVGIPVGVRQPAPLPFSPPSYLQTPQQQHQELVRQMLQQQQQRQNAEAVARLRYNSMINHNNSNNGSNIGSGSSNFNNTGSSSMWIQQVKQMQEQRKQIQQPQQQFRKFSIPVESDSDKEDWSHDSGGSLPPERTVFEMQKRKNVEMNKGVGGGGEKRGKTADKEDWSHDSGDSLPPERTVFEMRKQKNMEMNKGGGGGEKRGKAKKREKKEAVKAWGNSVRELTQAILKFGEAYEAAESKKLQHIVEMEMQRMKFAKELELQRMKFMTKTQIELSQLNGNGNVNVNMNVNGNASNNSDSRGGRSGGVGGGEINNRHLHGNHLNHANSDSSN
ncbi:unnamed protein product [Amaranthus hypochondriacus]